MPLVVLHGAGVDHRETEAAIEALVPTGCRRIYLDLPGMGRSTADGLTCNNDVVGRLGDFLEELDSGPVLLLGHSYGAYVARGVAAQRPELVSGLALVCPVAERSTTVPDHFVVVQDDDAYDGLDPAQRAGFDEYFVVRTRETARRYRDAVVPGKALVDEEGLGRIFAGWKVDVGFDVFEAPSLIVAGRHDSIVGYADAIALADQYPHASLAVLEGAGHALMHEQRDIFSALVREWLSRVPQ